MKINRIARWFAAAGLLVVVSLSSGSAQTPNDFLRMFGGIVQQQIYKMADAEWRKLPPAEASCIDQALRRDGSNTENMIQRGVLPSDPRLSSIRANCRTSTPNPPTNQQTAEPSTPPSDQPTASPSNMYAVEGIALGDRITTNPTLYRSYTCTPSEQFPGFTWCQKTTTDREARGTFTSHSSLLHSLDGHVAYVNRELLPAFWNRNEAKDDIERYSRKLGQEARLFRIPHRQGLPDGVIATWGNVVLEPLGESSLKDLAAGRDVREGLMTDYIANFRRSAQLGLPIYRLRGGAGFVWSGSWDQNGRGALRFLAINAAALSPQLVARRTDDNGAKEPSSTTNPNSKVEIAQSPPPTNTPLPRTADQGVIVQGLGKDLEGAVKNAVENALTQAIGGLKQAEKLSADRLEIGNIIKSGSRRVNSETRIYQQGVIRSVDLIGSSEENGLYHVSAQINIDLDELKVRFATIGTSSPPWKSEAEEDAGSKRAQLPPGPGNPRSQPKPDVKAGAPPPAPPPEELPPMTKKQFLIVFLWTTIIAFFVLCIFGITNRVVIFSTISDLLLTWSVFLYPVIALIFVI
jgi:hypothetical protein